MKAWTVILVLGMVALASCSQGTTYRNMTAEELRGMLGQEDIFLVDVHIPEQDHIAGTDAVIPFNEIEANLERLPRDRKIVVYCRSDSMSTRAAEELSGLGFDVYNLVGGTNDWRQKGYEFEKDEGGD